MTEFLFLFLFFFESYGVLDPTIQSNGGLSSVFKSDGGLLLGLSEEDDNDEMERRREQKAEHERRDKERTAALVKRTAAHTGRIQVPFDVSQKVKLNTTPSLPHSLTHSLTDSLTHARHSRMRIVFLWLLTYHLSLSHEWREGGREGGRD